MDESITTTDWCEITQVGLRVIRDPTWEEYEEEVHLWTRVHRSSAWIIADLYNFGEAQWGETYAQAMDETGLSYGYLANIRSVASRIELDRRNHRLSFSHHAAIAYLPPEQQDILLKRAIEEGLNRDDLRDVAKGLPAPGQQEVIVIPKLSLRQIVAMYVQATWHEDEGGRNKSFNEMVIMVKDLL